MSLESFKEKLQNLRGEYAFNFTLEDDSAYFFEKFGGEDRLKTKFPAIYQSYLNARESTVKCMQSNDGEDNFLGDLSKLTIEIPYKGDGEDGTFCKLSAILDCAFIDTTKKVCDDKSANPWVGITLQATVRDKFSNDVLINRSICVPHANSYNDSVLDPNNMEDYSNFKNRCLVTTITISGKDPAGNLIKRVISQEQQIGELYTINNIKINDPAPKNDKHISTNAIMMLYGRMNQQEIYADADYKGDDYLNNAFDSSTSSVHLLLPISGEVVFNCGVKPIELYNPDKQSGEKLTRSKATYDYKEQKLTYRNDVQEDAVLYEKLKTCFQKDKYQPSQLNTVKFDIRIEDAGRSNLDWHTDLEGVQNGEPKTIYLLGGFTYRVKNQLGIFCPEQISIQSITAENLKKIGREYYSYKEGENKIYIPPITIYWGCFGKDVLIKLADHSEKSAKDIKPGDQLFGYDNKVLTVEDVVTGQDTTIYKIETQNGGVIQVSGGHPMMAGGESVRASQLKVGDKLNLANGSLTGVDSIKVIEYNDTVYNFTFVGEEEGNFIIANDLYTGDLRMQNRKREISETVLTSEDKQFIDEMMIYSEEVNARLLC